MGLLELHGVGDDQLAGPCMVPARGFWGCMVFVHGVVGKPVLCNPTLPQMCEKRIVILADVTWPDV